MPTSNDPQEESDPILSTHAIAILHPDLHLFLHSISLTKHILLGMQVYMRKVRGRTYSSRLVEVPFPNPPAGQDPEAKSAMPC